MSGTEKFLAVDKTKEKQNGRRTLKERLEGKKQMIALWTTVLGLLSAQGIPAIVEALNDKPSTGQVQAMIGSQTEKLTNAQRDAVEAIRELDKRLGELLDDNSEHRTVTGRLEGTVSLLRDVLRDCCTRKRARERLKEEPPVVGVRAPPVTHEGHAVIYVESDDPVKNFMDIMSIKKKLPVERLEKVPAFDMQQQLQMQEPQE